MTSLLANALRPGAGLALPLAQANEVSEILWLNAPEPWVLFVILTALAGFAGLVYWLQARERPLGAGGVAMWVFRAAVLALVLAVMLQPVRSTKVFEDKDSYVAILIDGSLSMTFKDRFGDASLVSGLADVTGLPDARVEDTPRIELVKAALKADDAKFLDELRKKNRVRIYTFDSDRRPLHELAKVREGATYVAPEDAPGGADEPGGAASPAPAGGGEGDGSELVVIDDPVKALDRGIELIGEIQADGRETAIGEAIVRVLTDLRSERLASIVLISDGQNNVRSTTVEKAIRRCSRRAPEAVKVHSILVGNPAEPKDVAIDQLQAPDVAIAGDILNFDFVITQKGYDDAAASVELKFDDVQVRADLVQFREGQAEYATRLQYKPERPGEYNVEIRVPTLPDELTDENNVIRHRLRVIDQKIKVLYIEGYPRWEYRYLKNALVRERTMEVQCLLLSADPGFVQESTPGVPPLYGFPASREDLFQYHVIIFGDVDPNATTATGRPFFPDESLKWIKEFVEDFGGGFLMIAGETDSPQRYAGTPIAEILPIVIEENPAPNRDETWSTSFRPRLTREGRIHPIMRLEKEEQRNIALWEAEGSRGEAGALPGFYWFYKALKAKPAARVLASHPDERNQYGPYPVFVTMPYKSGTVLFLGTDETWRWRSGVGDRYFYKFWGQAVRNLAHGRFQRSKRFALTADRTRYFLGDDVRFGATVLDEHLQPYVPRTDSEGNLLDPQQAVRVEVESPDGGRATVSLSATASKPGHFEGIYRPTRTGVFKARLLPPGALSVDEDAPSRVFEVRLPSVELQEPRADRETMEAIAKETGGKLYTLPELHAVVDDIQPIIETIPIDSSEENLWDREWVILLFVGLLAGEWILRRVFRLP